MTATAVEDSTVRRYKHRGALLFLRTLAAYPTLAVLLLLSVFLHVRISLGVWPYIDPVPDDWLRQGVLKTHALVTFIVAFFAIPFSFGSPVIVAIHWKLEGRWRPWFSMGCILGAAALLYWMFLSPHDWGEWIFD